MSVIEKLLFLWSSMVASNGNPCLHALLFVSTQFVEVSECHVRFAGVADRSSLVGLGSVGFRLSVCCVQALL